MTEDSSRPASKLPERDVMILTDLEQIKVLADPLRIRILEELCQERTTKQVAERIGEKPTKLYHHVEALERVGLIALTRTRPNRGTLEKYYQSVARSFRADGTVFSAGEPDIDEKKGTLREVVRTIFHSTLSEMTELIDTGRADIVEEDGILGFVELRVTAEHIQELRERLNGTLEWLSSLAESPDEGEEETLPRHRLTLALYPLEPREKQEPTRADRTTTKESGRRV